MKAHHIFFGVMAVASALGLLKSAALAAALAPSEFSNYSAAIATVGIVASLLSFGIAEGTVKRFVRLINFGRFRELRSNLNESMRALALRHAVVLAIAPSVAYAAGRSDLAGPIAAVIVLALAANVYGLASSLLRGFDRLVLLGLSTLSRSVSALIFATSVALAAGWQAGLAAEAASSLAIGAAFLFCLRREVVRRSDSGSPHAQHGDRDVDEKADGTWLFAAFTIAILPISLDRGWLVYFATDESAAQYAFCSIWIGAAYTVTSIYAQKFGPEAIRSGATDGRSAMLQRSAIHAVALAGLLVAGAAVSFVALRLLFPDAYWDKYALSLPLVVATLFVIAVQVGPLFDWTLIALDGERTVATSACLFLMIWTITFGIATFGAGGTTSYLVAMGISRIVQISASIVGIRLLLGHKDRRSDGLR